MEETGQMILRLIYRAGRPLLAALSLSYKEGVGQKQLVRGDYEIRGDSVGLESAS